MLRKTVEAERTDDDDLTSVDNTRLAIVSAGLGGLLIFTVLAVEKIFLNGESVLTWLFG